jgi:hypothetical protein
MSESENYQNCLVVPSAKVFLRRTRVVRRSQSGQLLRDLFQTSERLACFGALERVIRDVADAARRPGGENCAECAVSDGLGAESGLSLRGCFQIVQIALLAGSPLACDPASPDVYI